MTMSLPSSVASHSSFATSNNGVVCVLVRLMSLMISFGFFAFNFSNIVFVSAMFFSVPHAVDVNHEYIAKSPSAHLVERLMIASICLSCRSKIICSSPAIAMSCFTSFRLSAICCAFSFVLLSMTMLPAHLLANSNAIPLAVPPAQSMMICLFVKLSPISLNLFARLSVYPEASEFAQWISSPKCAMKLMDCISSATGFMNPYGFSFTVFRHVSLKPTPSPPQIYLSLFWSISNIFSKSLGSATTNAVLISRPYLFAM